MRILKNQKIIFLSNPKTGSTTLRMFIDSLDIPSTIKSDQFFPFYHHSSAIELKNHIDNHFEEKWDSFYSFCLVRNPWKRAISNFLYSRPDKNFKSFYNLNYDINSAFYHSFCSWLKFVLKETKYEEESYIFNYKNKNQPFVLKASHLLIPIKWFAYDSQGNKLVSKIFKLENLDSEIVPFFKKNFPEKEINFQKQNSSSKNPKIDLKFDSDSLDLIYELFEFEIKTFEYKFNLPYKRTYFNFKFFR